MASTSHRRWLVVLVAAATVWIQVGLPVTADGTSLFRGRVLAEDGATPRAGVTIALVDEGAGRVFRSKPSDDRGVFRVDSAPPGTYVVVAESSEGTFLAPGSVRLEEGENPPVALALQPTEKQDAEPEEDQDEDPAAEDTGGATEPPAAVVPPPAPTDAGMSPLVKGILSGVVGLVAIAVVLEVTDEENVGSPF